MKKYRAKEIIEAVQWFKIGDHPAVIEIPEKYTKYIPVNEGATGFLKTHDGSGYFISPGDWIVKRENDDELYRYREKIFNNMFEEINDNNN